MDEYSQIRKEDVRASKTIVSVVQLLIILGLIVGIILMVSYNEEDTTYKIGKGLVIGTSIIIGLNILFLLLGVGIAGYTLYRINKMDSD